MPEARDRLVRPVDIAAVFARRRANPFGAYEDPPETRRHSITFRIHEAESEPRRASLGSPSRASTPTPRRFGTPRGGFGRGRRSSFGGSPLGRENTPVRRGGSVLPAWYPRTPLRDITAIVRAIERRRARIGEAEIEPPAPQDQNDPDQPGSSSVSRVRSMQDASIMSPNPSSSKKHCPPSVAKVHKILLNVTNQSSGEFEALTPQKKLLNSIDQVEKVVMEELKKMKRTPSARKAEREKRMRTLMSMR